MLRFSHLRFENLDVWKKAAGLCADIYKELKDLRDFSFRDQITRASLSISSNIAEGFERESLKECINFLSYAKGSCGEVRSQVYIAMKIDYINKRTGKEWILRAGEISAMLSGLIKARRSFINREKS